MKATAGIIGAEAYASTSAVPPTGPPTQALLNCDHGDPSMFEAYWNENRQDHMMVSMANSRLSYFLESKKQEGGPWFVSSHLDDAVRELHAFVGNAVTQGKFIVAGTGSTQLFQAALYALASRDGTSTAVVSEAPYYSAYPHIIDYLQSKLFHWAGDSRTYKPGQADETFVEMVTTPNNPCGAIREGTLVSGGKGFVVHDLAYYWPTYAPITKAFDSDIMLFTMSKCTGHAGLRVGWAVVKDPEVARKMATFIEMNTIGLSQDAQLRAAGLMRTVVSGYEFGADWLMASNFFVDWTSGAAAQRQAITLKRLFHWSKAVMESRWTEVRDALAGNANFSLPDITAPATCTFSGTPHSTHSAFMWLKCEAEDADCQALLKSNGILARGGAHFGVSPQYARVSLLGREPAMDLLIKRLRSLQ